MTEALDWVGHNVYLFNNRTSLTVLHGYNGTIENLKLKTESEDIHPLFHPSSIRVDPINGTYVALLFNNLSSGSTFLFA